MCERKPGPRCSNHALKDLQKKIASGAPPKEVTAAQLIYNATPEGMAKLEQEVASAKAVRQMTDETAVVGNHYDGSTEPVFVPVAGFLEGRLKEAKEYREWQTATSKTLADLQESRGASEAKLYADLMVTSLQEETSKIVNHGISYKTTKQNAANSLVRAYKGRGKTAQQLLASKEGIHAAFNAHAEESTRARFLYHEMKISDLKQFVEVS